jgi:hypothetical protein
MELSHTGLHNASFSSKLPNEKLTDETRPAFVCRHLWVRNDKWEEMGKPDKITVSIEPGVPVVDSVSDYATK